MQPSNIAALACFLAAGSALLVGQLALADARDVAALYWLVTGAVALRASLVLTGARAT